MLTRDKNCVGSAAESTMKMCGAVTKYITEGFFTVAPFMRPRGTKKQATKTEPVKSYKSAIPQEVEIEKASVESEKVIPIVPIVEKPQKSVVSEPLFKKSEPKESEQRERAYNKIEEFLTRLTFTSKIEKVQAEIYVKDFDSKLASVRDRALEQIKKMSKEFSLPIIIELLKEKTDVLQVGELLNALSSINEGSSVDKEIFKSYLNDKSSSIRMAALRGIVKYKDDESFALLTKFAKNDEVEIRRQTLNLLYWTYGVKCLDTVMMLMHDLDNSVRIGAMQIVGSMKEEIAVSPLITNLSDPSVEVQKSAGNALKKITGKNFGFSASGSDMNKKEAIEQWRFWWLDNQGK